MKNYQTYVSTAERGGRLSSYDPLVHFMSALMPGAMGKEELLLITVLAFTYVATLTNSSRAS